MGDICTKFKTIRHSMTTAQTKTCLRGMAVPFRKQTARWIWLMKSLLSLCYKPEQPNKLSICRWLDTMWHPHDVTATKVTRRISGRLVTSYWRLKMLSGGQHYKVTSAQRTLILCVSMRVRFDICLTVTVLAAVPTLIDIGVCLQHTFDLPHHQNINSLGPSDACVCQ